MALRSPTGGLLGILNAYESGVDTRRGRAKETADSQEKQDEFNAQHAPYFKGKRDEFGFATGQEPNEEGPEATRARAYLGLDKEQGAAPPSAQPVPAPQPQPSVPPAQPEPSTTPSGRPIGATQYDLQQGGRAPNSTGKPEVAPGDPKPLIRDPKAALQTADQLVPRPGMPAQAPSNAQVGPGGEKVVMPEGAKSMIYDTSDKPVTQNGQTFIPARQTNIEETKDLPVEGTEAIPGEASGTTVNPAQDRTPAANQIPDAYTLKRLVDMNTTLPRAASGYPVDVNNLPPDVQESLGVTPEMLAAHVKIPASIVNAIMGNQTKRDVQLLKNEGQTVDPKFQPVLDQLQQKKIPLGTAIAMATRLNGGARPPQAVLNAMKAAGTFGNADRNYGMAEKKFNESVGNANAKIAGDYAKNALKETKLDLEAINTMKTVDNMLQRKDTNGLRRLVPIIIERGFVPQRLTNQMISADTGLSGLGDKLDQWLTGMSDGTITPENILFFRSLVKEGIDEHSSNIAQKNYRWKRAGAGALMNKGMEEGQALEAMDRALSGNLQGGSSGAGGASSESENPAPKSGGGKLDAGTDLGRAKLLGFKNQALRVVANDPKLSPEQKKAKSDAINKKFEADMAAGRKKQGI